MNRSQQAAQPRHGSQPPSPGQSHQTRQAAVSLEDTIALTTTPHHPWTSDPALASQVQDLPPRYDFHQFPPTPPALATSDFAPGSYFDQPHLPPCGSSPHSSADLQPSEQPPRSFASRFPRWGTWLEKRAMERHYAQLDSAQLRHSHEQSLASPEGADTPNRKKSWGAWVNDPNAVNDELPSSSVKHAASSLPSLHTHHFGSRFIPHLPAQPLCSIVVELTPPSHSSHHIHAAERQILLVGTVQGLFALQFRSKHASTSDDLSAPTSTSSATYRQWNDSVRCIPVWTGLAVYQMCVLASQDLASFQHARNAQQETTMSSGVLLALTSPSSAKDGFLASSLIQLSAHAGSVLESVAASAAFPSTSSSSSHSSHGIHDPNEGVAAANFGSTSGGGPGRAVPPGGTGVVRMWHLQAIRELLVYALDRDDAQLPIDLAAASGSNVDKRAGLGSMFKRRFSRQKPGSENKRGGHERSISSGVRSTTVQPLPTPDSDTISPSRSQPFSQTSSARGINQDRFEQAFRPQPTRFSSSDRQQKDQSPRTSPRSTTRQVDPAHAAAIRLAFSSVPIQPPSHATAASHGNNVSFTSLFADDLIQSFSGARQAGAKGKDRESSVQAASKGVLFFSVHEADKDTKASGTWYLAIAYARSVLVYEAAATSKGASSRAWSFLKELYAPFPIKAVAFAPAAVSDELHPFVNPGSFPISAGPTKLRVTTADGTLTAKKASHREQGRVKGDSSPVLSPRGSAAPASWHKADLCLMLSFGRRSVLVRLRDSQVREMEVRPLAQLLAAAADDGAAQLSLQTHNPPLAAAYLLNHDRSRPRSVNGDGDLPPERQLPNTSAHSRTGSMEQKIRDTILDKRSVKHNWVGFSAVEARIFIRQCCRPRTDRQNDACRLVPEGSGPSLMGIRMARDQVFASPISVAPIDKALPQVPAQQNASFDRRISRLHLSEEQSRYHDQLEAESSSDSDDGYGLVDTRERAARYQLTDPGPLPRANERRNQAEVLLKAPNRAASLPPAEPVSAKVALATKGSLTHILPLPLAADVAQASPLAVMQWSDTPNAVSGWARVLGVERVQSHPSQSHNASVPSDVRVSSGDVPAANQTAPSLAFDTRRKVDKLNLHVGVTCAAFMASRIESRKVSFKIPVEANFDLLPDSELELVPLSSDTRYARAQGGAVEAPKAETHGGVDATNTFPTSESSAHFPYPPVQHGGQTPAHNINQRSAVSQELEYLCAPLLTLNPVDLDVRSSGAQSLVLPLSHTSDHGPTAHAMLPDLGGDAGIIAFDWRGADDFRIFTVGIAG
ncbi:hypothetical protein PHSY_004435 [Pseudozyma hubeiensis SY62]|uniref:Uncharacterized protein n=1 Tax=Pseudozyma hubeiensis (strain SY62) TaxID=1305764 RepID=R9P684_PSEHS|nr:hypothetical protein PHSY_004435 [Pseudozyma hubeiensis SY62]GAC96851.1 hypothetical protein PHSY_004435 [Pseudozyma hubeiensis SY62]